MDNNFYVYIYLDQRKSKYSKFDMNFNHEPFYVGKGKNNRSKVHLRKYEKYNLHKKNRIKAIRNQLNEDPKILIFKDNLNENEAMDLEVELIRKIGRFDLGFGPLLNLTDGGDGWVNPSNECELPRV